MATSPAFWILFNLFILGLLALDLGVFHRKAEAVSVREAALWSAVWIALAIAFGAGIFVLAGPRPALEFLTGYLIEKSLSVDNIFIFVLVFSTFAVPAAYQRRVLFWGILSALVLRGAMIGAGAYLLARFHWILYVFGAFLVATGIKMLVLGETRFDPEQNRLVRLARRVLPMTPDYRGPSFVVRDGGRLLATPLLLVLLVVEFTDVVFAVDSIPAIFAITEDPFLVYTSNVFAILGLRSLYFLLHDVVGRFHHLKTGLALILMFVGTKMLLTDIYKVAIPVSLGVIAVVLAASVAASLLFPRPHAAATTPPGSPEHAGPPGH